LNWRITIDLVGESRKNELLSNHELATNKKQDDQRIKRYRDNESNDDGWDAHPTISRLRKMQEERRKRRESAELEYNVPRSGEIRVRGLSSLLEIVVPTKETILSRGAKHLNSNNEISEEKDSRIDEIKRLARKYRLTYVESEEFHEGTSKNTNLIENGHETPMVPGSSDSQ